MVIIEMNPRVSRSSALASKATGFPIAKIAAKLAVGYTLDEIPNDITKVTPACFEPTIDYCVVKIPRFTFEKFPEADPTLTVSMKSVGEAMAIGRTFKEALQKGLRSLEIGVDGLVDLKFEVPQDKLIEKLRVPNAQRIFYIKYAFKKGMDINGIYGYTKIDRWFLHNIKEIVELEKQIIDVRQQKSDNRKQMSENRIHKTENKKQKDLSSVVCPLSSELLLKAKQFGFSDKQLAKILKTEEEVIRQLRTKLGIKAVYKSVDTCGAEFEAYTPYYYSTYEKENESN
jgi:carbamoyl-phosphate synthase large subunit